jgi:hypothetical protein
LTRPPIERDIARFDVVEVLFRPCFKGDEDRDKVGAALRQVVFVDAERTDVMERAGEDPVELEAR